MSTSLTTSIKPEFRTIDGLRIRYADSGGSQANAEFLHERLPTSRLSIIDAGHFIWEEAPAEYTSIILDSIRAPAG